MAKTLQPIGIFTATTPKYLEKPGKPGQIVYGSSADNRFSGRSEPRLPVAFAGGAGSDSYQLKPCQLAIVADLGGGRDTLDITGIDRAAARWGKIKIDQDYLLTDLVSGMAVLLHDPNGVLSANNKIEDVKAQYRDPLTGAVDASRSERVKLKTWLANAIDFNAAVGAPPYLNYDAYNQALGLYRQLNASGQLQPLLESKVPLPFKPLVHDVTVLINALPTTVELGLNDNAAVLGAWQTAAANLGQLG